MWPDHEDQRRPPYLAFLLSEFKRIIIYHRDRPHIRAVFYLAEAKANERHEIRQEVIGGRVEWDHLVSKRELRQAASLLDEFSRIEERGCPRGTRRPKRQPLPSLDDYLFTSQQIDALRQAGLHDRDLKILFDLSRHKKQKEIARELKISPSAVSQRLKKHIEPAIRSVNPKFSLKSLKSWVSA
jgi:predicted DNA binding protein